MCGRYTLTSSPRLVASIFDLPDIPNLPPRYNIAPSQAVAVVRAAAAGGWELVFLHWGLIPSWAADPEIGSNLINARVDTVAEMPAFRSAFLRRRCLIPADGFLEWAKAGGNKQPYHVRRKDRAPFALAGLWEWWQSPEGAEIESCTILTTAANALVWHLHDRMPVIIDPPDFNRWLDPGYRHIEGLTPLLVPYAADAMEAVAVSTRVNSPEYDGPECLEPVA